MVAQRRVHYEHAFEQYLRVNRVPYVAVNEARKALLPAGETLPALKSFDFVVHGLGAASGSGDSAGGGVPGAGAGGRNLLLDIKGRKFGRGNRGIRGIRGRGSRGSGRRYESWVTRDDVESLTRWEELFGPPFEAVFIFVYWCDEQPPDALFDELFEVGGRWYALREVSLAAYRRVMIPRSAKWETLHVPAADFARVSRPFSLRPASTPPNRVPTDPRSPEFPRQTAASRPPAFGWTKRELGACDGAISVVC